MSDEYITTEIVFEFLSLDMGQTPPSEETISAVARAFARYVQAEGARSLDECFFGQTHRQRTSIAYKENLHGRYMSFHVMYAVSEKRDESVSLEKLAEQYLQTDWGRRQHAEAEVDSFLRGYRRWLKKVGDPENINSAYFRG